MADLFIKSQEQTPEGKAPTDGRRENASLVELAKDFHLFTLGPVYIGAKLDVNLLDTFAKEEEFKFEAVTIEQPYQMFKNLNEWDYMIQGIERTEDEEGRENSAARNLQQWIQNQEFVRQETRFYAKVYSRPVIILPRGHARGVSVEVFLLASNKGTQEVHGANPYEITVDPLRIATHIERDAEKVLDILGG